MNRSDPLEAATRLLARRPLTEYELRRRLEAAGHAAEAVEATCRRLHQLRYLDDRALAVDFIVARAARLGHGPQRMARELERRGVAQAEVAAAFALAAEGGDYDPREALRGRIARGVAPGAELDRRGYARMYNALRRAGFDEAMVEQELEPYRVDADPHSASTTDETDHELA